MEKLGFTREDLSVFGIDSKEAREKILAERVRPRLEEIAYRFAGPLSKLTGKTFSASIALPTDISPRAHATTAFVPTGADIATAPYFTFSLTRGGVHARLVIERQLEGRDKLSKLLTKQATALAKELSTVDLRCYDDWDGRGVPAPTPAGKAPFWKDVAERLGRTTGSLDIGQGWPEARAVLLSYEDLLPAYRTLVPLYKRLTSAG